MKESSKTEGKSVSIKFEQIMDLELKVKYVTEAYGQRINNNEILNSDVWAMIIVETDELCSLITTMKKTSGMIPVIKQ